MFITLHFSMANNNNIVTIKGQKFLKLDDPAVEIKTTNQKNIDRLMRKEALIKALPKMKAQAKNGAFKRSKKDNKQNQAHNGDSIVYRGPMWLPNANEQADVQCFNVGQYTDMSSTSDVIDFVLTTASVQNVVDWNSIAAVFAEYRVLAMECNFVPKVVYTTIALASVGYPAMAWVTDRDTNATLGSYNVAATHESCVVKSIRYPHTQIYRMNGVEEAVWTPVGTAFSNGFIKAYGAQTGIGSIVVGHLHIRYVLQVRGKQ